MKDSIQTKLLEIILEKYPKKANAVEELAALLSVGKDAVYRRLRGDTLLTPDEIKLLARNFNISLDELVFEEGDVVFMNFNIFQRQAQDFQEFIHGIHDQAKQVYEMPESHFYYASHEVPVFHYMYFPELISFKLYVWGLTSMNFEYIRDRQFSFDLVPYSIIESCKKTIQLYNQVPSTELWSIGIIDNTLNQIEYVATVNQFENLEDALLLCDKLSGLINHQKLMAEHGKKFSVDAGPNGGGASFELYHNELVSTNETILVTTKIGKIVVTTFCSPNFFRSTDQKLGNHTEEWLQLLIEKSSCISKHSAKDRAWFFNRIDKKVKAVRSRIEMMMEEEI